MNNIYIPPENMGTIKKSCRIESTHGLDCVYKILDKNFNTIIDCRIYFTRSWNCACCIWIKSKTDYLTGSYKTSGCGFDKRSEAIAGAVYDAGIKIKDFGGAGENAAVDALEAIARKVSGKRTVKTIKSHC